MGDVFVVFFNFGDIDIFVFFFEGITIDYIKLFEKMYREYVEVIVDVVVNL